MKFMMLRGKSEKQECGENRNYQLTIDFDNNFRGVFDWLVDNRYNQHLTSPE